MVSVTDSNHSPNDTLRFLGLVGQGSCPIADGDTITVLRDKEQVRIRLYGIDCPEGGQAFGTKAKQFTSDQVFGKVVEVETVDTDRYGRTVALVTEFKRLVNEELVNAGFA